MKAKKKQTDVILKYLLTHKRGITQMRCTDIFGFSRLASIIGVIKDEYGRDYISDEYIKVKNRFGDMTRVKRYWL